MLLTFLVSLLTLYIPPPVMQASFAWPWTPLGVGAMAALNAVAYCVGSRTAMRLGPSHADRMRAARIFKGLKMGIVAFVALDVFFFEWPGFVMRVFTTGPAPGTPVVPLVGDVVLLSPVLIMIGTAMVFRYRFECRRAFAGGNVPALSLGRYLSLRFRTELGILLLPWMLLVLVSDCSVLLWGESPYFAYIDTAVSIGLVVALVSFGPLVLRVIWDTSTLPSGGLRSRLEDLCEREGFGCRDILVWHTHKHIPNAAVIGFVPPLRYVMVTDSLLENCTEDEVEGIFAHEVGHVRQHHLRFYLLFALTYGCIFANVMELLGRTGLMEPLASALSNHIGHGQAILMLILTVLFWVFGFGYISRRMEQQADLYALRKSKSPDAFILALEKLSLLSGRPSRSGSWRHFSVWRRTRFLRRVLENPEVGARAHRKVFHLRMAVGALFVVGAVRLLLIYA
jgi:Zn-dependent protease with chaperone function